MNKIRTETIIITTIANNKILSIDIVVVKCNVNTDIMIPAIAFPINIPNIESLNLIFKIEAIAAALHDPVVGNGIPTNTIIPIMLTAFSFLVLPSIFISIYLIILLKYFLCLRYSIIFLKSSTIGIATNVAPITQTQ